MAYNDLVTTVDHRGLTIGIGRESQKARSWEVLDAGQVVANGAVEQQGNKRGIFRQAIDAAQAAIDQRLDGKM